MKGRAGVGVGLRTSSLTEWAESACLTSGRCSTAPLTNSFTSTALYLQLREADSEYSSVITELCTTKFTAKTSPSLYSQKNLPYYFYRCRGERTAASGASRLPNRRHPRVTLTSTQQLSYAFALFRTRKTRSPHTTPVLPRT